MVLFMHELLSIQSLLTFLYHTAYDTIIFYIQIKNIMTTIK
ncbi:hypothetical protein [Escherichia coli IS25]|nr:hypothetical protein [Escherichia coli IS25]